MKNIKLRYKYLIFNAIWCLLFSTVLNIIFYLKINEHFNLILKVEFILLIVTSLISQIDMRVKTQDTFDSGVFNVFNVFFGMITVILCGIFIVGLLHIFFDYQSFFIKQYLFVALYGLAFSLFMPRIYLYE